MERRIIPIIKHLFPHKLPQTFDQIQIRRVRRKVLYADSRRPKILRHFLRTVIPRVVRYYLDAGGFGVMRLHLLQKKNRRLGVETLALHHYCLVRLRVDHAIDDDRAAARGGRKHHSAPCRNPAVSFFAIYLLPVPWCFLVKEEEVGDFLKAHSLVPPEYCLYPVGIACVSLFPVKGDELVALVRGEEMSRVHIRSINHNKTLDNFYRK